MSHHFASESVCAGHPDKICDQISDAIVDAALKQDPNARLGIETMAGHNQVILAGEIRTTAKLDYEAIAREQIKKLGYTKPEWNFSDQSPVQVLIHEQSPEIAVGVDAEGAGDQGMMFGYAVKDTPELMPLPILLAHRLTRAIDETRETGKLAYLRPDGKAQVVVEYENDKPVGISHVTTAVPHNEDIELEQVKEDVYTHIVSPIIKEYGYEIDVNNLIVNGTGVWHHPGPESDAGLTGRNIVVDTYGGYARVGGGAFSGKDPSKVDRSGAYAARYIAKNIVAHDLADEAEVRLAYYIGGKAPVMLDIETFGSAKSSEKAIADFAAGLLTPSVSGIIDALDLRRPIYLNTAAYGHFGRNDFPWEAITN